MSDQSVATPPAGTGPLLAVLIARGPGAGNGTGRYSIRSSEVSVGRGGDNDLVVGDPSVSERHATLRLAGGVWSLADLGSMNGSWIDGQPVRGSLPLASGSAVRLGTMEFVFAPRDHWQDSPIALLTPAVASRPTRSTEEAPGYVLALPERRELPMPLVIGLVLFGLALAGYFLLAAG